MSYSQLPEETNNTHIDRIVDFNTSGESILGWFLCAWSDLCNTGFEWGEVRGGRDGLNSY